MTAVKPPPTAWCRRDAEGRIVAVTRETLSAHDAGRGHWQALPLTDGDLQDFLQESLSQGNPLSQSDGSLARVLEDLIDVLITRGLLQFTDLPEAAQAKLFDRRRLRASLPNRLDLLPDDRDPGLL